MSVDYSSYFQHRGISGQTYLEYEIPPYVASRLPEAKDARILDFGCGFGQFVRELIRRGYTQVCGYDIEPAAIEFCKQSGLPVIDGAQKSLATRTDKYDLIFSSHVMEHIPKDSVIETLRELRGLLTPAGSLFVCVPNAQSNTGAYWAYEDFTHCTLFTSGSLYYVLSKAGYSEIAFVDVDCTEGMTGWRRPVKRLLLNAYSAKYAFWNRITNSQTHKPSPNVFSYELKAIARA